MRQNLTSVDVRFSWLKYGIPVLVGHYIVTGLFSPIFCVVYC